MKTFHAAIAIAAVSLLTGCQWFSTQLQSRSDKVQQRHTQGESLALVEGMLCPLVPGNLPKETYGSGFCGGNYRQAWTLIGNAPIARLYYNSSQSEDFGLGPGFAMGWHTRIRVVGNRLVWRLTNGTAIEIEPKDGIYTTYDTRIGAIRLSLSGDTLESSDRLILDTSVVAMHFTKSPANSTIYQLEEMGTAQATVFSLQRENNRVTQLSYSDGRTVAINYNGAGKLTSMEQGDFQQVFTYDFLGRVSKVTNSLGQFYQMEYGSNGALVKSRDLDGTTRSMDYDTLGRVTKVIHSSGKRVVYQYEETRFIMASSADILVETFADNRIVSSSINGLVTQFERNENGAITAVVDPYGQRTEVAADAVGLPVAQQNPDGTTTTYQYDDNLRLLVQETSGEGYAQRQEYQYNAAGQLTSRTTNGVGQSYHYNAAGQLARIENSKGRVLSSYTYNEAGKLLSKTDGFNQTTAYSYTPEGRLAGVTTSLGLTTTYGYDANGRITMIQYPDGLVDTYAYNGGDVIFTRSRAGIEVRVEQLRDFDQDGLLTAATSGISVNGQPILGSQIQYDSENTGLVPSSQALTSAVTAPQSVVVQQRNIAGGNSVRQSEPVPAQQ